MVAGNSHPTLLAQSLWFERHETRVAVFEFALDWILARCGVPPRVTGAPAGKGLQSDAPTREDEVRTPSVVSPASTAELPTIEMLASVALEREDGSVSDPPAAAAPETSVTSAVRPATLEEEAEFIAAAAPGVSALGVRTRLRLFSIQVAAEGPFHVSGSSLSAWTETFPDGSLYARYRAGPRSASPAFSWDDAAASSLVG